MRLLIAALSHETNTFSPVPTPFERFCPDGATLSAGPQAVAFYRGTGTCLGGFIAVADSVGAEIVLPVAARAAPSGPVESAAYERFCGLILDEVAKGGLDGIMLELHGAMVAEGFEDGEGELLRRLRAIDPRTPVAVSYDMHANLYPAMVENATVLAGYHTYPHVDQAETAMRAGQALLRVIRGDSRPTMAWGRAPMIPHVMAQGTHRQPNAGLQQLCQDMEEAGDAIAASLFVGFPHADIEQAGLSVVVATEDDPARAQALVDELLDAAWKVRAEFVFTPEPLSQSVARAKQLGAQGPGVFLLDHYDNCASGGTMDTTAVLAEMLRQGLTDAAFFGICDPAAVQQAIAAGPGAEVTLALGGKLPMPAVPGDSPSLTVTGTVRTLSSGWVTMRRGTSPGLRAYMGPSAVIDSQGIAIVLVSRQIEPVTPDLFIALGIDITALRFIAIKSRVHWRAGLGDFAREVVECAGLGVCTSDYASLRFERLRRPIYPLDAMPEMRPA